jgi:hypothetical protein
VAPGAAVLDGILVTISVHTLAFVAALRLTAPPDCRPAFLLTGQGILLAGQLLASVPILFTVHQALTGRPLVTPF